MPHKPSKFAIIFVCFLNFAWAGDICDATSSIEVSSLVESVNTIYPNVASRSLHYLYKHYVRNHPSCRDDQVWVQGPIFSEDGVTSEGDNTDVQGEKAYKLNNSFCMSTALFEFERGLGKSIFQTRVSSGSKNQGTSFLISKNIIMTNHHIAAPGADGKDCKKLEITLNKEVDNWVSCKKVLFCDKDKDVCFVEMNQASPGVELGDLVPRMKLNCGKVETQSGILIGNSYKYGIQGSAGPITKEYNGKIKHHIPMVGGASGSPILSSDGEVIGINYGHSGVPGKIKDFVSMNENTDSNTGTSMSAIRKEITTQKNFAKHSVFTNFNKVSSYEDLSKIDYALKLNPSCNDWAF